MRIRLLLLALAASSLLVASQARADCTPIVGCDPSNVTCTTAFDSQCSVCAAGRFLVNGPADTCQQCTSVAGCTGAVTCTTAIDSQCTSCAFGRYLQQGSADTCPACAAIDHCQSAVSCTGPSDSQCTDCGSFFYLNEDGPQDACVDCTDIPFCAVDETCTSANTSRCASCPAGFYIDHGPLQDSCTACSAIAHCASPVFCTSASSSQCTACEAGFDLQNGTMDACTVSPPACPVGSFSATGREPCTPCAAGSYADSAGQTSCTTCLPIAHCVSTITCTSALDSQCIACEAGFDLQNGTMDACTVGPPACSPGSFSATGLEPCTPCAPACASGEYETATCTTTSDRSCAACDASCVACSGPSASDCTGCSTGDAPVAGVCAAGCSAAPAPGCRVPSVGGKAKLSIKDAADNEKDNLHWSWAKGAATSLAEFGDPLTADAYFLCVYDGNTRVSSTTIPAGGTCGKKPCWAAKKKFLTYRDPLLTPDGALTAKLTGGAAGKASVTVFAKGANLETPDITAFTGPIRVQLQRADRGICFESVFSAPFKKNAKGTFIDFAD